MTPRKPRPCTWPDGCDNTVDTSRGGGDGLCAKHYQRVRRAEWYGKVSSVLPKVESLVERAEQAAERAEKAAAKAPRIVVGGRPPARGHQAKFSPDRQEEYLQYRADGLLPGEAAKGVGVTIYDVQSLRAADPNFAAREKAAQELAMEPYKRRLMQNAMDGDTKALNDVLANFDEEWRPASAKQSMKVSGAVDVVHDAGTALERIAALTARLEERKALGSGQPAPGRLVAGHAPQIEGDVIDAEVVYERCGRCGLVNCTMCKD